MRISTVLCPALALAVAIACSSSIEPETVEGTWYLHAYNDSAVPGVAVFRSGSDSSLIAIDSVRLQLNTASACSWLVHLANQAANLATTCIWTLDASPDDIMVTVDGGFVLRGDAGEAALLLRDPNGNLLQFEREPAVAEPEEPNPL